MKFLINVALAALAAGGIAFAGAAHAAPVGGGNAEDLVMQLQARGNTVIVNRTGSQPLSQCTVTSVRAGQSYSRYDSGYPGAQMDPMTQVTSMTVFVDASC
ncbi:hypothetical protein [Mycolicibacterium arenosum]|uniref:DUF732 domain-containing protein n=1 Tax=Mycolicibacterium arenosum TaxID=2952157 RepID=A0ABT1MCG7_9MYCO|nr:hypothetical protein [Mycolicibacterium sp. CAU 1645]MCP9276866.1 hypothetical protein [Mycolicibacterium sp. CAU 1645]